MIVPAITITETGLQETIRRVDTLTGLFHARIGTALSEWAETVVTKITEGHPPGGPHPDLSTEMPVYGQHAYIDRTGRLTRSVGFTVEVWTERVTTLTVFALMPYAESVEFGTPRSRPYPFFWPVIWEYLPRLDLQLAQDVEALFTEYAEYGRS
jgi:hypothetical protein